GERRNIWLRWPRTQVRLRYRNLRKEENSEDDDADSHSTISAVSSTARSSTSAPAVAHSLEMFSASLWLSPSTQGHITMVEGATLFAQHASWPAPEMMFMWL